MTMEWHDQTDALGVDYCQPAAGRTPGVSGGHKPEECAGQSVAVVLIIKNPSNNTEQTRMLLPF